MVSLGLSHYLSQCWSRSMSPNGVTRPQWVKIQCWLESNAVTINFSVYQMKDNLTSIQAMAWCHQTTSHYTEPMLTQIYVTICRCHHQAAIRYHEEESQQHETSVWTNYIKCIVSLNVYVSLKLCGMKWVNLYDTTMVCDNMGQLCEKWSLWS